MYIQGIISEEAPKVVPWGDNKWHVILNVHEDTIFDSDGNEVIQYTYDCVERIPSPITVANIIKVAAAEEFGDSIFDYVAQHLYNAEDSKVKAYTEFVDKISEEAKEMGYE